MARLVLCPTCGRKISENARSCPHCGETEFFRTVSRPVPSREVCPSCGGVGWECSRQLSGGVSREFIPLGKTYWGVTAVVETTDHGRTERRHKATAYFPQTLSAQERAYLERCVSAGRCKFRFYGGGHWGDANPEYTLYYGLSSCPRCGGSGYVTVNRNLNTRVDLRLPAEPNWGTLSDDEANDILSRIDFD